MLQDVLNGFQKSRSSNTKLFQMKNGKACEDLLTVRRELNQDLTPVAVTMAADDCAPVGKAVQKLDSTVVPQAHARRQGSNGRALAFRQPFYGEQKLMLLRLQAMSARSFFTEMQELPDSITEFGELTVTRLGQFRSG